MKKLFLPPFFFALFNIASAQVLATEGSSELEFTIPSLNYNMLNTTDPWARGFSIGNTTNGYASYSAVGNSSGIVYSYIDATGNPIYDNLNQLRLYPEGYITINNYIQLSNLGSSDDIDIIKIGEGGTSTLDEFKLVGMFAGTDAGGNSIKFTSQWNDNLLVLRGNGNVGIGITNPTSPLYVQSQKNRTLTLDFIMNTGNYTWQSFQTNSIEQWRIIGRNTEEANLEFWNKAGQSKFTLLQNGSVGIGTSTPLAGLEIANSDATGRTLKVTQQNNSISNNSYTLEVDSSIHNTNVSSAGAMAVDVNSGRAFTINGFGNVGIGTSNPNNGKLVVLQTQNINQGGIVIKANSTLQSTYLWMDSNNIMHIDNANNASRNIVFNGNGSGNVGIGTTTLDTGYKLTVKGNVSSREVRVTATAGGADFVFEDDYNLPSLETVENFIKDKKHLPEIPSAKEMEENGINLAEMNIKLLQKVEELTLYIIEQEKRINAQEKSIKALESKLEKKE